MSIWPKKPTVCEVWTTPILYPIPQKDRDRFWAKVKFRQHGCWDWTSNISPKGYPTMHLNKVPTYAHRIAYTDTHGPIPCGMELDHLCRNTQCVNPAHLEAVTHKENCLRGNGPPAVNAKKTHCIRGHELSGDNVRMRADKYARQCLACINIRSKRRSKKGGT